MNTAARMESTGLPGCIQASSYTADLIIKAGRQSWVIPRPDLVTAKGKGQMQTYWINPGSRLTASRRDVSQDETRSEISSGDSTKVGDDSAFAKDMRLIEFTVDQLLTQLQKIVAARGSSSSRRQSQQRKSSLNSSLSLLSRGAQSGIVEDEIALSKGGGKILEEYSDVIEMPKYYAKSARRLSLSDENQVDITSTVKEQLREYVTRIAAMYRDVQFHNFEVSS